MRRTTGPLTEPAAADVRALARRAADADGVAPLSEQPLLHLTDPAASTVHLTVERAGGLVGYAQLDISLTATADAELVVDPVHRRQGLGRELLAGLRATAAEVAGRRLQVWAHGDLPQSRAFATAAGLHVVRELWQLRLDLQDRASGHQADGDRAGTAVTLPPGVRVRTFVPGVDDEAWLRVNARAFAHHPEQGRMTAADLRARQAEPWFDPAGLLLAVRDRVTDTPPGMAPGMAPDTSRATTVEHRSAAARGDARPDTPHDDLLAFLWTKVHPAGAHGPGPVGEIYVLGVDPDAQGLGLGTALTRLALDHLATAGLSTVLLYVEADNTVAVRTYIRAGFVRYAADVMWSA